MIVVTRKYAQKFRKTLTNKLKTSTSTRIVINDFFSVKVGANERETLNGVNEWIPETKKGYFWAIVRKSTYIYALFVLLGLGSCTSRSGHDSLPDLNLLSGNWEDLSEGGAKVELWTSVGDQHLKGKGVVLTGLDTTCIETLEIKIVDDTLRYLVRIPGQSDEYAVVFTLGSHQGNTLIFENKKYPFPQFIVYELKSQVELRTAIEGRINGEFRKEEFWLMRKDAQE